MQRYRITTSSGEAGEQTWVLLPDRASAIIQAEELAQREKSLRVRVYHEASGEAPVLALDLAPRDTAVQRPPGAARSAERENGEDGG